MAKLRLKQFDSILTGSLQVSGSSHVTGSSTVSGDLKALGNISGSSTSTGSFGSLRAVDPAGINITAKGNVSGSATSTGSFGQLEVDDRIGDPSDSDTYIDFTTADEINFYAGGERLLHIDEAGTDEVVIGDGGHVNFRAATAGYGYNLYVKSDNPGGVDNSVGIRNSSPQSVLDVTGDVNVSSHITSSGNISASGAITVGSIGDTHRMTGSLSLSGSLHVQGQTIMDSLDTGSYGLVVSGAMSLANQYVGDMVQSASVVVSGLGTIGHRDLVPVIDLGEGFVN